MAQGPAGSVNGGAEARPHVLGADFDIGMVRATPLSLEDPPRPRLIDHAPTVSKAERLDVRGCQQVD